MNEPIYSSLLYRRGRDKWKSLAWCYHDTDFTDYAASYSTNITEASVPCPRILPTATYWQSSLFQLSHIHAINNLCELKSGSRINQDLQKFPGMNNNFFNGRYVYKTYSMLNYKWWWESVSHNKILNLES